MPRYFGPRARRTKVVPRKVQSELRRDIRASIIGETIFPNLDSHVLRRTQEAHPDIRTVNQALTRLLRFENIRTGGTKRADVYLRHPTERKMAKLGRISWDANGEGMRPDHEMILHSVANLFDMPASEENVHRQEGIPGIGMSPEERINLELNTAYEKDREDWERKKRSRS